MFAPWLLCECDLIRVQVEAREVARHALQISLKQLPLGLTLIGAVIFSIPYYSWRKDQPRRARQGSGTSGSPSSWAFSYGSRCSPLVALFRERLLDFKPDTTVEEFGKLATPAYGRALQASYDISKDSVSIGGRRAVRSIRAGVVNSTKLTMEHYFFRSGNEFHHIVSTAESRFFEAKREALEEVIESIRCGDDRE